MALEGQPIFRAPSVPKIGRRNVSSSIFSSAASATPKLKTSSFSFIQPQQKESVSQTEALKAQARETNKNTEIINSTLVETNRILVEIQRQLSSDFAARANEKRQSLAASKSNVQRQRISAKERSIERINKLREGIGKAFDKVTAPARSIFAKIKEFFGIILTGILVNSAWKWLQNPKNREKVGKFFQFVADHWRWIVRIIVLGKLLGFVYKLYKIVQGLKKAADLLGKSWELSRRSAAKGGGKGPGGFDCNAILRCLKTAPEFSNEVINKLIATGILANTIRSMLPQQPTVPTGIPPQAPLPPPILGPAGKPLVFPTTTQAPPKAAPTAPSLSYQQIWDIAKQSLSDPVIWGIVGSSVLLAAIDGPFPVGDAGALANLGRIALRLEKLNKIPANSASRFIRPAVARSKGGTIPKEAPKKKCSTCSLLPTFSTGGTVGGAGSGNIDSVPAMLAPGEEVIRSSAANLFRPLLKDINDNAGRMWQSFQSAIGLQEKNNAEQQTITRRFSQLLEIFNAELRGLIQKQKLKELKNQPNLFGPASEFAKTGGFGRYPTPETGQPTSSPDAGVPGTGAPTAGSPTSGTPSTGKPYKPGDTIPESATKPSSKPTITPSPIFRPDNPDTQTQPPVTPAPAPFTVPAPPYQSSADTTRITGDIKGIISAKPSSRPQNPIQEFKRPKPTSNIVTLPMPPINLASNAKLPSMPQPFTGAATEVPAIPSFDVSNPYIMSTPQEYGIFA